MLSFLSGPALPSATGSVQAAAGARQLRGEAAVLPLLHCDVKRLSMSLQILNNCHKEASPRVGAILRPFHDAAQEVGVPLSLNWGHGQDDQEGKRH